MSLPTAMVSFMGKTMVCNHPQRQDEKAVRGRPLSGVYSHVVSPTPDQITKLGIARTFQNIRLFRSLTVFDNVLIAKHMSGKAERIHRHLPPQRQGREAHAGMRQWLC